MKNEMESFLEFIREQGVVGLAVGFILGGAVSKVVASLVDDVINPLIALVLGSAEGMQAIEWTVGDATLHVGNLLAVIIDFIVISAVVYFGVKKLGLDKMDKAKE